MLNRGKTHRPKISAASGVKALISTSALAGTLVGWALLGKQELGEAEISSLPASSSDAIVQILGPLPTLVPQGGSFVAQVVTGDSQQLPGLRIVHAPSLSASRPAAITRTQSSR
ncbi:MAG: hypothetical protein E4G99_08225 [Anaerolineales bacterium]|nr:MAG: hypothetical protein E4G99_08225 [Anaerolineales bacterium]